MKTKIKLSKSKVPSGYSWTIDFDNGMKAFNPSDMNLHLEPEQKKSPMKGEVLFNRLKNKSYNADVLEYLLEHKNLIPEEWKSKVVYFWGTIYRDSVGYRCVRCLYWSGSEWDWSNDWLDGDWRGLGPALVPASPSSSKLSTKALESLPLALPKELVINGIIYIRK